MNQERSLLRAAGSNAITLYLDRLDTAEQSDEVRGEALEITLQVIEFVQSGQAADLTQGELRARLGALVPEGYQPLFDQFMGAVSPMHMDVRGKIGLDNVRRIEAVCRGIVDGTTLYKIEDRKRLPPPEEVVTPEPFKPKCEGGVCVVPN